MKEIREWLENEGHDYAVGVTLYAAHGSSSVVLNTLRYGESTFTRQKLREELQKLAPVPQPATQAPVGVASPVATSDKLVADVAEQVRLARSSWYAERHRLHATLELLPTDAERRVAAERIVALSAQLTASYQAPDVAPLPAPGPDLSDVRDQGEIRRLLANLRPQVSKLKKNPARVLDLQQAQAAIKLLENKLLKQ